MQNTSSSYLIPNVAQLRCWRAKHMRGEHCFNACRDNCARGKCDLKAKCSWDCYEELGIKGTLLLDVVCSQCPEGQDDGKIRNPFYKDWAMHNRQCYNVFDHCNTTGNHK